jgi:hypothetical protein
MEAFAFRHAGFRFAVPNTRVTRVLAERPEAEMLTLVEGAAHEPDASVFVELDCKGGARVVPCTQAGVITLGPPQALPGVVASVVRSHLVGWSEVDGELVWLLDVTRLD